MTLLVMTILIALNNGGITYNGITYNGNTYNWFYFSMTLLKTVNQKGICKIKSKVAISKVFISIVALSLKTYELLRIYWYQKNWQTF